MYLHTSLSVLISFIFFSYFLCFFFSLHLSLYLLFVSRNLLLSILFLLHSLYTFTYRFLLRLFTFSVSPSIFPPYSLTVTYFFVVAYISFSSGAIFSTSCSSNVAFSCLLLYSSTPCSSYTFIVTFFW
jgi:hypothetical protein